MVMVVGMEDRKKQDKLQAVWFAAGVAALMACLERAMLVSFVEQWRVIAFLALNLLLLAILFTSRSTPITPIVEETSPECISDTTEQSKIEKKRVEECKKRLVVPLVDEVFEEVTKEVKEDYTIVIDKRENKEDQLDESIDETQQISMEELNERAEAFIAMFRQHLISDAKAYSYSKSCRIRTPITLKGGDKNFTTIY
ncbi:PREDICTED: uncharacterized protein LOC109222910 [Nicotiana attenuata]|uniref:Uncharacterized protein n=1 Tax=Nicotiana attenuata TaxID=49451 RepID=A0A1J6J7U8_NICAT|nr:PREDICTED: uncharacterized protein LOC109222910 [Nicotiana attenuata]OIT05895.1 hypothetical protein A4A49_12612 [Nicotiana attenuata]